jgi:hypothetical protein
MLLSVTTEGKETTCLNSVLDYLNTSPADNRDWCITTTVTLERALIGIVFTFP